MASFKAILGKKCPRCGEGNIFEHNKSFTFSKKSYKMNKNCPSCDLKFEKEVGFFYGAMFVSYALNIALFLISLVTFFLFFEGTYSWTYFAVGYLLLTALLTASNFRLSRSLWLALMIKADPKKKSVLVS